MIDLDELERLEAAATRGPWRVGLGSGEHLCSALFGPADAASEYLIADNAPNWAIREGIAVHATEATTNLRLMLELRNAAPDLIAAARRVEVLERMVKSAIATLCDQAECPFPDNHDHCNGDCPSCWYSYLEAKDGNAK